MIKRILQESLKSQLSVFPSVAILGPRQVGKTTMVRMLADSLEKEYVFLDLENPDHRHILEDPMEYFRFHKDKTVIIDEIQRLPDLFPMLRVAIDEHRIPGRFIITGSASPQLVWRSNETLAGRVIYHELSPLLLIEINQVSTFREHWIRGGFPEPFLQIDDRFRTDWFASFMLTYVERDLPMLGLAGTSRDVSRLISMLSHNNAALLNMSNLSRSLDLSVPKISSMIDFLERAYLLKRLQPWHFNTRKRMVKSPKIYFRDTGILHHHLRIHSTDELLNHPTLGGSWETYVINQIIGTLGDRYEYYFYRTADGAECDLVIASGINVLCAVEVKFGNRPASGRGLSQAIADLKTKDNYIIVPEISKEYLLRENLWVTDIIGFLSRWKL